MEDKRNRLADESPFSFESTKDGKLLIYYQRRLVMTVGSAEAAKLRGKLETASDYEAQLILAKVTGNFKHGNER